jgi:hypothetical protein
MANEENETETEETLDVVGEWEPMIYNEFAIGLSRRKKGR